MDFIEFAVNFLLDYIIYILAVTTFITLILTVRVLMVKRKVKNEIPHPPPVGEVEQEIERLPDEGELKREIMPLPDETEIEQEIGALLDEGGLKHEIRPLLEERTSESCEYCTVFKDLGTMVCPNCGRPLNLRLLKRQ